MKLWQIIALVALCAAILAGIGYSYRATYNAGHTGGYNQRVGEESKAYAAAEDKGRKAQETADQHTIGQLQQDLADERQAEATHVQQLADLQTANTTLQRRLDNVATHPDAAAWFAGRVPDDVLCSLQQPPAGSGAPAGCPSH